jgi:o-succinylbenzoate synthase
MPAVSWQRYHRRFPVPVRTGAGVFAGRDGLVLRVERGPNAPPGFGEVAPWPGFGCETLDAAEHWLQANANTANPDAIGVSANIATPLPTPPPELPCLRAAFEMAREWPTTATPAAAPAPASEASTPSVSASVRVRVRPCESVSVRVPSGPATPPAPALTFATLLFPGHDTPAHLARHRAARTAANATAAVFKLKITADPSEPARVADLLARLLPGELLRLDANASLDALAPWLPLLADPRVEFLEQPFPPSRMTPAALAALPAALAAKLALDESVSCAAPLPEAWPGVVVIKPAFLPDWAVFRRWRAAHPRTRVVYSSVFETAIGRAAALRLALEDPAAPALAHGFPPLPIFTPDPWDDLPVTIPLPS